MLVTEKQSGQVIAALDRYKGGIAAGCLSVATAALFVLRSKASSSTCDEIVLWYSEVLKFAVSTMMCYLRGELGLYKVLYKVHHSFFPTIGYMCISLLTFWALPHMDASTAAFISQLKLPATALFSYLVLRRTVSKERCLALVTILLASVGVAVYSSEGIGLPAITPGNYLYLLAMLAIVAESFLSAFTGVYIQWIMEGSAAVLWVRNIQLAALSTILYLAKAYRSPESCTTFMLDTNGIIIAVLQGTVGIAVALTLLWLGAIEKTLASISSIVLTSVWEHVGYIHAWPPLTEVVLDAMVLEGIIMYSMMA